MTDHSPAAPQEGTTPPTDEIEQRIAGIEARLELATPGPWRTTTNRPRGPWHDRDCVPLASDGMPVLSRNWKESCLNAAFIAHAPDDVSWLIAELRRSRATSSQPDSSLRAAERTGAWRTKPVDWAHWALGHGQPELAPGVAQVFAMDLISAHGLTAGGATGEDIFSLGLGENYNEWREFQAWKKSHASSPTVTPPQTPNGVSLITAERQRQIDAEGWTMAHDDTHKSGEMALAAAVYAWPTPRPFEIKAAWPWPGWFKPTTPEPEETQCGCRSAGDCPHFGTITPAAWRRARIRDLTKAGALIAAEIDRLSRAARSTPTEEKINA